MLRLVADLEAVWNIGASVVGDNERLQHLFQKRWVSFCKQSNNWDGKSIELCVAGDGTKEYYGGTKEWY